MWCKGFIFLLDTTNCRVIYNINMSDLIRNLKEKDRGEPSADKIIAFGTCIRHLDMSFQRFRNDVINGISPSLRYGVTRNGSAECVSVTAVSRDLSLEDRLKRVARGNWYFENLFNGIGADEGNDFIPFAYVLDFKDIASQQNVREVKQNWGFGKPGKGYEGLENYIKTPGDGNYWEGEVRVYFHDFIKERGIDLKAGRAILLRDQQDRDVVGQWASQLRSEGLTLPNIPIFTSHGDTFLGKL